MRFASMFAIFLAVLTSLGAEPAGKTGGALIETNPPPKTNAVPPVDLGAMFRMHWDNQVRLFKEQNQVWRNVVLLGDSITEGFNVTKYLPGRRVLNRGIGADIIGNALPTND